MLDLHDKLTLPACHFHVRRRPLTTLGPHGGVIIDLDVEREKYAAGVGLRE